MLKKDLFAEWLKHNTMIADSSIKKYTGAINTISKELMAKKLINNHLYELYSSVEAEQAKQKYFSVNEYKQKDERGNRMYSRALIYYIEFLQRN